MPPELAPVESELANTREEYIHGIRFVTGKRGGRNVVIAKTGCGKVNAAMVTVLLIDHFRPSEVIYTGVAGGINPHLRPGDVLIGTKTSQHDRGTIDEYGFKRFHIDELPADARLLRLAEAARKRVQLEKVELDEEEHSARIVQGVIVTGDAFIASSATRTELRKSLGADAVEMEGAAAAQVCARLGVPCLVVRSISDSADTTAWGDYRKYRDTAARNSAAVVLGILHELARESSAQNDPEPAEMPTLGRRTPDVLLAIK